MKTKFIPSTLATAAILTVMMMGCTAQQSEQEPSRVAQPDTQTESQMGEPGAEGSPAPLMEEPMETQPGEPGVQSPAEEQVEGQPDSGTY